MSTDNQNIDISAYKRSENDCGSPEYQIAKLTKQIAELTGHCQQNKKDKSAIKGMVSRVNKRKKLLKYLYNTSYSTFTKIVKELKIRYRIAQ
ncbi:30S ribosomal protein S15 [Candidatus Synchoanobacter obligatus]|uniref:Small ribosomal subunit protein uS15 n=1 Tax=Candidatus Synchoanobacter obligatus TaxID=2919597 RepID=A0ABT1L4Y9_9GAMM|nr:30S ribosomal protein S15 [Candidatus Synchoanobacter obligatus]MCP8351933.1 30S ribosomal protein S15 [Candidatus Synchoanobacter obligatus]